MSSLEQLQPASKGDVIVYSPYYPKNKQNLLPLAISLYQKGSLEGQRTIEGSESIPFAATWYVSKLPHEVTRCRLLFSKEADFNYEVMMSNHEFIDFLIDLLVNFKRSHVIDFPQAFYRKLLRNE